MSTLCGYKGCKHLVAKRGACGERLCPKNAEKLLPTTPDVGSDFASQCAAADPFGMVNTSSSEETWKMQRSATTLADLPADTPIENVTFAAFDVETNQMEAPKEGEPYGSVIQVAVVTLDGKGNVLNIWSRKIKPLDGVVGPTHIHRITEDDVLDSPTFAEVLPELLEQLDQKVEVAHNHSFDRKWLDGEMARYMDVSSDKPAAVDTLRLARKREQISGIPLEQYSDVGVSQKLGDVCEQYGVELEGWHDAAVDAEATGRLLPHLFEDNDIKTVGDLLEMENSAGRHLPRQAFQMSEQQQQQNRAESQEATQMLKISSLPV